MCCNVTHNLIYSGQWLYGFAAEWPLAGVVALKLASLYMLSKLCNLRTHESSSKCPVSSGKCIGGTLEMSVRISKRKGGLFLEIQGFNLT